MKFLKTLEGYVMKSAITSLAVEVPDEDGDPWYVTVSGVQLCQCAVKFDTEEEAWAYADKLVAELEELK